MGSNSYCFTDKAKSDLDEILDYLSSHLGNAPAAKSFYDGLFSKIDSICAFPNSCEEIANGYAKRRGIRKALVGSYVVYYVYDEGSNLIVLLRIVYGARNLEEILRLL